MEMEIKIGRPDTGYLVFKFDGVGVTQRMSWCLRRIER